MTTLLTSVLALTERVETLVGQGNWIEASEVERERRRVLERYVQASNSNDIEGLEKLLERNRRTLETALDQRATLAQQSAALARSARALNAYSAHGPRSAAGYGPDR